MIRILSLTALITAATILVSASLPDADACAALPRENGPSISIAEESALIVWNPAKKIQHFIRRAAFDTRSPDFGFLVPTPSAPELPFEDVEDGVFKAMDKWILPRVVEQDRWQFEPFLCAFLPSFKMSAAIDMAPKDSVRVLHEQKVGGFDVSVLQADDADALAKWIKDHGYSADPELYDWLKPYVAGKWTISAFKISHDPKAGGFAQTKAVRMSFKTDRPFFPYREPESKDVKATPKALKDAEPTEIDGIWRIESAEGGDAKERTGLKGTTFWFGNGVAVARYMKDINFKVDSSKDPKWLDLGNTMPGIYKIEGDTLHWCRGNKVRPGSFDAKEGLLLVLKRDTKAEADKVAAAVAARAQERLHSGNRLLRVQFVSDTPMDGQLGAAAWHAKIPWSDALTDEQRKQLVRDAGIDESDFPPTAWLTVFEDRASPRPGKDEVYFDPVVQRTPIRSPDFVKYNDIWIPVDCVLAAVLLVAICAGAAVARIRKRRQTKSQTSS